MLIRQDRCEIFFDTVGEIYYFIYIIFLEKILFENLQNHNLIK